MQTTSNRTRRQHPGRARLTAACCLCAVLNAAPALADEGPPAAAPAGAVAIESLGVHIADLSNAVLDERRIPLGVAVVQLRRAGPAALAGLRRDDVIYALNGLPTYSPSRLRWIVEQADPASGYRLSVIRDDVHLDVEVVPGRGATP